MRKILIINGPNLNMLGQRETSVYGDKTLDQLRELTEKKVSQSGLSVELTWFQSNIEGELVSKIQEAHNGQFECIIINPGGYSHTSVAILDAMKICKKPIIEVHLSNVYQREAFRQTMLTAQAASIIMAGLGHNAYWAAIQIFMND